MTRIRLVRNKSGVLTAEQRDTGERLLSASERSRLILSERMAELKKREQGDALAKTPEADDTLRSEVVSTERRNAVAAEMAELVSANRRTKHPNDEDELEDAMEREFGFSEAADEANQEPRKPDTGHACPYCDFVPRTARGLANHINAKHPEHATKAAREKKEHEAEPETEGDVMAEDEPQDE